MKDVSDFGPLIVPSANTRPRHGHAALNQSTVGDSAHLAARPKPHTTGLADALAHAGRILGGSQPKDRITHGIPLIAGELQLDHLEEAAERIGLTVSEEPTTLDQVSPLAPPFIAFTKTGAAFVVTELDPPTDRLRAVEFRDQIANERVHSLKALAGNAQDRDG